MTGGKWEMVEDIIFTPEGKRMEQVVYAPVPNLEHLSSPRKTSRTCAMCSPSY